MWIFLILFAAKPGSFLRFFVDGAGEFVYVHTDLSLRLLWCLTLVHDKISGLLELPNAVRKWNHKRVLGVTLFAIMEVAPTLWPISLV